MMGGTDPDGAAAMPTVRCPACRSPVALPEPWTAGGFTCPYCHRPTVLPPALPPAPKPPTPAPTSTPAPLFLDDPPPPPRAPARVDVRHEHRARGTFGAGLAGGFGGGLGCVLGVVFGLVLVCGGAIYLLTLGVKKVNETVQEAARDAQPAPAREPAPTPRQDRPRETAPPRAGAPAPAKVETPAAPEPKIVPPKAELDPKPAEPPPVADVEVAPPPRAAGHKVPPGKWVSAWRQPGEVRVRVLNVSVRKVPVVDAVGKKSETAPVLAVWVEVENTGKEPRELRTWQTPFEDHATLRTNLDRPVGRARVGAGNSAPEMGQPRRPLPVGEPQAVLLLFQVPGEEVLYVTLSLDGTRFGEAQFNYNFQIPAMAWR
jgi:hypothetical protein